MTESHVIDLHPSDYHQMLVDTSENSITDIFLRQDGTVSFLDGKYKGDYRITVDAPQDSQILNRA